MWPFRRQNADGVLTAYDIVLQHFGKFSVDALTIQGRVFPYRVRADLQQSFDEVLKELDVKYACGVQGQYHQLPKLADCLTRFDEHQAPRCTPPQFQDVDIGDEQPIRCQETGLWMVEAQGEKLGLLMAPHMGMYHQVDGLSIEITGHNRPGVLKSIQSIFKRLEEAVNQSRSYRGKILSLEKSDHDYTGRAQGIKVHRLRDVSREQVILPRSTLELLDRNVIGFVERRDQLRAKGLSTRKGLLFYGPPGTGKTHTIHYLTRALPGHTTLIITAEQVGALEHYMTLARLLQPSIVVIEDVDLIGRDRQQMNSPCEESLLNKLLNHMDGLKESADILFILTTNRPQMLEPALAARPGRIDQAIDFPLPDDDGRRKLIRMYAAEMTIADDLADTIVRKTVGVSAAFIKELMRRSYQFQLEANGDRSLSLAHVDAALEDMLFRGGELNRILLGATGTEISPS